VATDCLLVSSGLSFHNETTKLNHVPLSGIFLSDWLFALCAEPAENFCLGSDHRGQPGLLAGDMDDFVAGAAGARRHFME
jgi:hypothetical protein